MSDQGILHRRSRDFGKTPEVLMHDIDVTDGAVRLYSHMHWRYGQNQKNFEGLSSMAEMLGVTEQTIAARIKELESKDWVVVIERGLSSKTGNFQTPFYHVFEVQRDARELRKEYQPAEGESIRAKPTVARKRKSRKGVGGTSENIIKFNEDRTNSNKSGRTNLNKSGPTNLNKSGRTNLNKHYPDSSYPDSITPAPDGADAAVEEKENPKPERTRNLMFDAVCQYIFEIDPFEEGEIPEGGRIGAISAWLEKKSDRIQPGKNRKPIIKGFISNAAKPEHVKKFAADWKLTGANLPLDFEKFVDAWRKWASAQKKNAAKPLQSPPITPELTNEQRAELMEARKAIRPSWETQGETTP